MKAIFAFISLIFVSSLSLAETLSLPEAIVCARTVCTYGSCDSGSIVISGMTQDKDGKYKELLVLNDDSEWFGYVSIIPNTEESELEEPNIVKLDLYEDGHAFMIVEFYDAVLADLASGKKDKIYGSFKEGIEWGGYNVDGAGLVECTLK